MEIRIFLCATSSKWFSNSVLLRITEDLVKIQNIWSFPLKFIFSKSSVAQEYEGRQALQKIVMQLWATLGEACCPLPV